jgi:hypothetical protein
VPGVSSAASVALLPSSSRSSGVCLDCARLDRRTGSQCSGTTSLSSASRTWRSSCAAVNGFSSRVVPRSMTCSRR